VTTAYRIGDCLVSIRASERWLDHLLRSALAELVVPDLAAPYANFSIRIERPDDAREVGEPVHVLYSSGCLIARSREPRDVLAALLRELAVIGLPREQHLRVKCAVLVGRDARAMLISVAARRQAVLQARRLAAVGLQVIDTPAVIIDPVTLEAVVPAPTFAFDAGVFHSALGVERGDLELSLQEQRYQVAECVIMSLPGKLEPAHRAVALVEMLAALWDEGPAEASALGTLADVIRQARILAAGGLTSLELMPLLVKSRTH